MQELLGRLRALDPAASQGLRVIACFDELMAGHVGTEGLLSAAAALAGRPVGAQRSNQAPPVRVDPSGRRLPSAPPPESALESDGLIVWIEGSEAGVNDAIILERLALAIHLRDDHGRAPGPRDLAVLFDDSADLALRRDAATRRGLPADTSFRAIAAPLFAVWRTHPAGPEDVVRTDFGPVHTAVIPADSAISAAPLGIGIAVERDDLATSFRTAVLALRLSDTAEDGVFRADDLGVLAATLADQPVRPRMDADESAVAGLADAHTWAPPTLDALVHSTSVREAARTAGVHHSTMTTRIDVIASAFGFDPLDGWGRTRMAVAYLRWRVRSSHVLELPAPVSGS
ncbi:helix-turn-helix domain-containing protein [Microbacterium sp. NIBRBAC000506063]|uniref:helix-turn-helix domain-containing protein n=1 Tax=Microbacterium sp. NIBRBAC000506063 TaxID=2734618 RepID=UPI001BB768FC|nr:helix-turn-helix domain-containing protein [Microbacterium sp. NIBRBAC000506063]QTV79236.1 helix-turn-helix domain-containing protein [Microbacterium sp. NIBRBAC000506063]